MKILLINSLILFTFWANSIVAQIDMSNSTETAKDSLGKIKFNESKNLENADEIFLKMTYAGLVNTTIISYYYKNEFYFPFREFCENLEIFNEIENNKITGFLNNQSNTFKIEFNPNTVTLSDVSSNFTFVDYLKTDFDYYFNADFYKKIFGLGIKTDFGNLVASLQSKELMPIFKRMEREKLYNVFSKKSEEERPELLFPRERKIIGGAIFDYNFGYSVGDNQTLNRFYNFKLGGELLGGDGEISTSGNIDFDNANSNNIDFLWRFVFDKNKYLRTVTVGDVSLNGLYSLNYTGIKISNDQVEPRQTYATQRVYEKTSANWSVEIYISSQLIAVATADAVGDFYFDMPLSYGTTLLEMKFYGPGGEYYEQTRLYQTPYYLLRPDEFIYFINYGSINNINSKVATIKGAYGINEWITTEVGYHYLENDISENIFYNSTTARFLGEYLFNVTIAPDAYLKLAADVLYFSQTSFGLEYTRYLSKGYMNPSNLKDDFGANFFIPFRFPSKQINIRGSFNYAKNNNQELYDYSIGTSASLDGFNPSLNYNYIKSVSSGIDVNRHYLDFGFSYFLGSIFRLSKYLSGNLMTFRSYYDTQNNKFDNYTISLSTTIKRDARLQVSYARNFIASDNSFQLQLILYLQNIQVNSSLANSGFRLGGLGSLTYDEVSSEVNGFNRLQVGRSTAAFRFYIDSNGNSEYDEDEEIIKNGNILMGTSVIEKEESGIIRARELDPYTIYSVDIDESAIRNPLLVPGIKRFSFVADPNTVKNIDIPFYIAGEIDGKVSRKIGNSYSNIGGIKIYIKNINDEKVETVVTFSDGSYYYFGLRPGNYIAYVDEKQLKIIGIKKRVEPIEFTISPIENGDIIMNVDFILE
ncbi:MAG: hypothetical protein L3J41_01605 [Melioribacteraceae bacterium]|nr:hypothetical protein [Melioribacteraceae bacterium]